MDYSIPPPLPPPPPPPSGSTHNAKLFLAGCIGVMIVGTALLYFTGRFIRNMRGPRKAVSDHLLAISKGEYRAAYGYLSPEYQKEMSYKDFQMDLHPFFSLLPFRSSNLRHVRVSDDHASIEGIVTGRDGSLFPVYYELDRKNGKWIIVTYRWVFPGERISL